MKKKHSGPQIVAKLRQADVLISQGKSISDVCRQIEVSEQTYYRWRVNSAGSPNRRTAASMANDISATGTNYQFKVQ